MPNEVLPAADVREQSALLVLYDAGVATTESAAGEV